MCTQTHIHSFFPPLICIQFSIEPLTHKMWHLQCMPSLVSWGQVVTSNCRGGNLFILLFFDKWIKGQFRKQTAGLWTMLWKCQVLSQSCREKEADWSLREMPREPESPDSKPTHQALRHVAKIPESQIHQSSAGLSLSPESQAPVSSCLLSWLLRALWVLRPKQELVCDLPCSRWLLPCLLPSVPPSLLLPSFLSLLNLLQHCFCFLFWVFLAPRQCGILAPQAGMEPAPPALEDKVLTPELPGNSPHLSYSRKGHLHSPSGSLPISHHQLSVLALKSLFHPSVFSTCTIMILPEPPDWATVKFSPGPPWFSLLSLHSSPQRSPQ